MVRVTPINCAEAIIEPFWDIHLSGLSDWVKADNSDIGLRIEQNWCWVDFSWQERPDQGPPLSMSRLFKVSCPGYDKLVVSIVSPPDSVVKITAETEIGLLLMVADPAPKNKRELVLDLKGANTIETITIEIYAAQEGAAAGWINWIGLQDSPALEKYLRQWDYSEENWEPYLKSAEFAPSFAPQRGIFIDPIELNALREKLASDNTTPPELESLGIDVLRSFNPESCIGEYVNLGADERYNRERDHGKLLMGKGKSAALAGTILKDADLLRLAARCALSIALCDHWDDGFICRFPGSTFEHRAFTQSMIAQDVAAALDLAGDLFTDLGKDLLYRRLSEQVISAVIYNTWKHEYIFECNQLLLFSAGRLLAYLVMESDRPRVSKYTDIAYNEVIESISKAISSDGSFLEGPGYFGGTIDQAFISITYYRRSRGIGIFDSLPECLTKMSDFGEVIASTDNSRDVMRICDAGKDIGLSAVEWLAAAAPDSYWTSIYRRMIARGRKPTGILTGNHAQRIPLEGPRAKNLVIMPEMGVVSSLRVFDDKQVKVLIMGNKSNAGHCHEDKGSFILEYGGETFADDPGTFDYSDPRAEIACECEWHNMLVPYGSGLFPHPDNPLLHDIKPEATGDEVKFHAQANVGIGWNNVYDYWNRTWDSPEPNVLVITDDYKLNLGDGVKFHWMTMFDVMINGNVVNIDGSNGRVVFSVPDDCEVDVEKSPDFGGNVFNRISIRKNQRKGNLIVKIKLC